MKDAIFVSVVFQKSDLTLYFTIDRASMNNVEESKQELESAVFVAEW